MPTPSLRGATLAAIVVWGLIVGLEALTGSGLGLRAQYFTDGDWSGTQAISTIDREVSTAQVYKRWQARPPRLFSVQWSGFLHIRQAGTYVFELASDDRSQLYIDQQLVVDNPAGDAVQRQAGSIQLAEGPHAVQLRYRHDGDRRHHIEWRASQQGSVLGRIPGSWLTPRARVLATAIVTPLEWSRTLLALAAMSLGALWGTLALRARRSRHEFRVLVARALLLAALGGYYVAGAKEHARVVNLVKSRADQTGYLVDAQQVYANWSGRTPQLLVGQRMRMPAYAAFLAALYDPAMSDVEFWERAKIWNICLSVALLAGLAVMVAWRLPPLASTNLTLVVAFGIFIFKAGYTQPELLAYSLFFAMFVASVHLLINRAPRRDIPLAVAMGGLAGVTHLSKAVMPPYLAIFAAVFIAQEGLRAWSSCTSGMRAATLGPLARRLTTLGLMLTVFFAVVWPYIHNSRQVFGEYFFNQNTSIYMWYDGGAKARAILVPQTDEEGRVAMPRDQWPTGRTYWNSHRLSAIADRLRHGTEDMVAGSYRTFGYLKYVVLYAAMALVLAVTQRRAFARIVRRHGWLGVFLGLYAMAFLASTAFFEPISGTGTTRFLLMHAAPLFFILAAFCASSEFRAAPDAGPSVVRAEHLQWALAAAITIDLSFFLWTRLMTTFGGF